MIEYYKGTYGFNLLYRVHGSAVYKAVIPGLISVLIFLIIRAVYKTRHFEENLDHPYAVGVLVSSVSFLIVFRANHSYQRYWEACGAVHTMMSKWLDTAVHTAAFHMQCSHYEKIRPPSFFDHPEHLQMKVSRDRERKSNKKSIMRVTSNDEELEELDSKNVQTPIVTPSSSLADSAPPSPSSSPKIHTHRRVNSRLMGEPQADGGWGLLFEEGKWRSPVDSWASNKTPSLFLQELAHLSSLLVAVAFCTLRNDIEGSESPLDIYKSGSKWPEADPEKMPAKDKQQFTSRYRLIKNLRYWFGMDRTPQARTQYNAARPMPVLGGVSDGEIRALQAAKGASAKTQLAWMWLSEFITREHLAGSTGKVGPPIISRLIQFLSDGMIFYNHARKIMYIPFPFPHAQISAVFILVVIVAVPFMMEQYADSAAIGSLLTFATVVCLAGLHEVARELENPFRNVPNDIPLCTLLAMFNESLITMCSGFHPDSWWDDHSYGGVCKNLNEEKKPNSNEKVKELLEIMAQQASEIQKLRDLILQNEPPLSKKLEQENEQQEVDVKDDSN